MCADSKVLMGWTLGLIQQEQSKEIEYNKFIAAVLKKGGAEGWVQVELDEIYNTLPNVASVEREQPIFANKKDKVDFLIGCRGGSAVCVEIKVETLFHSADLGRVALPHRQWQPVSTDVQKLQTQRTQQYAQAPAYAVAIVWSQEAIQGMDWWLRTSGLSFLREQFPADHPGGPWPVTVYVIVISGD